MLQYGSGHWNNATSFTTLSCKYHWISLQIKSQIVFTEVWNSTVSSTRSETQWCISEKYKENLNDDTLIHASFLKQKVLVYTSHYYTCLMHWLVTFRKRTINRYPQYISQIMPKKGKHSHFHLLTDLIRIPISAMTKVQLNGCLKDPLWLYSLNQTFKRGWFLVLYLPKYERYDYYFFSSWQMYSGGDLKYSWDFIRRLDFSVGNFKVQIFENFAPFKIHLLFV